MALLPVLTPAQAAEWDMATAARGVPPFALMESAGRGAVAVLTARFPSALRQGTLVLAGAGNNGGDGWAIARGLHALGLPVWVAALPGTPSDLNRLERTLATEAGVREVALDGPWPAPGLLVDAILGTGAHGAPREPARTLLARVADLALPIVAVDGPSGLDLDDGVSHGALPAVLTVTFGGFRRGHLLARDEVGDVLVLDIGFVPPPPEWPRLFSAADAATRVLPFASKSHKGTRGRVAVVGGDAGMSGAARMASRAAFAAGAGLVHALAPAPTIAVLAQAEPDLQTAECPFDRPPTGRAAEVLAGADAVVIGPGLGRAPGRAEFVAAVAELTRGAIVLDADGLIAFGGDPARIGGLVRERGLVLTPHAGEFRALFPDKASRLATDPWTAASEAAALVPGVTLLAKGVPTVIAGSGPAPLTVAAGNPGLATGGSGDTLSGLIAAWLAQGLAPAEAAAVGAVALGEAADLAARRTTARGLRPMDVIAALPDLWRAWELRRRAPAAPVAPILYDLPAPLRV
jgi:ADP-dependent NAD(P)H-hydrate dehydratase / NAD(P)H-hydrate epimerase